MRLTVIQMNPSHDKAQNLVQARQLVEAAISADRPELIALPEVWSCLGGPAASKSEQAEVLPERGSGQDGGPAYEFLRDVASTYELGVHGGSIIERAGDRLFNTSVVFDADGNELARYRKMHLFDITTPDGTGYRESAMFGGGDEVVTFDFKGIRVGCAICYDVRFAELFLGLRRRGAELILLPAAFTLQTGKDHWETLIRARAIETQCWFAAPATWGQHVDAHGKPKFTYGHSLICDPWGNILARVSDGVGWATARVDQALTRKVRADMPVLEHRKLA